MKKVLFPTIPGKLLTGFAVLSVMLLFGLTSCYDSDDVGDTYYTFTGVTMGDYIEGEEQYSEFAKILRQTNVMGLLKSYGKYTCFLPTNEAMRIFYEKEGRDTFPTDTLTKIVYDHIFKDFEVPTEVFEDGFLPYLTMSGRFVNVAITTDGTRLVYRINNSSTLEQIDIDVHNGIIHTIDTVLSPTENTLVEAIANDDKFSLFYEALVATGLDNELVAIKDESYIPPSDLIELYDGWVQGHGIYTEVPRERKFGFTALMESDATYAKYGVNNLEDLKSLAQDIYDKKYPEDAGVSDLKDRRNSLNRFIAYHLINKKISKQLFIEKFDNSGMNYASTGETHSIKIVDMFEYIETMCPNTLMEVRTLRSDNTYPYNIFNMVESGDAVRLTDDYDNDAVNGAYHEIDGILAYTEEVDRMLKTKRLRLDGASFFPELTNNNMRVGHASPDYPSINYVYPQGYFDRIDVSETTEFGYINADDRFCDYQGDEIFLLYGSTGLYDFEMITPPIPEGTYEIRFGYQPTGGRGAAQLYWDGIPAGIPLDLRLSADHPKIGWVQPGQNPADPSGFENDKMMRNRGYMKGPDSYKAIDPVWYPGATARSEVRVIRRILGIYTFDKNETHRFHVRAVRGGQFMFDYLEFVPVEVIENEDIH